MNNKESNFVSAVIYVHNNADIICDYVRKINEQLQCRFKNYEIICVDDGSYDDSVSQLKSLEKTMDVDMLTIVELSYFQGLEVAMTAGVDMAIGDFVYEFDKMVFNYEPDLIYRIYQKSLEGFDIVSAVSGKQKTFSSLFYSLFNKSSRIKTGLKTETFRIISRRAINRIRSMSHVIALRKALYSNSGLGVATVSYTPVNKDTAKDEDMRYLISLGTDSLLLFTNFGYHAALALAGGMMLLTVVEAVYALIDYFKGVPIEGYTTTILMITMGFFAVFALLAVVIKYLSLILNISFNQNQYMIRNVEKLNNNKGEKHD